MGYLMIAMTDPRAAGRGTLATGAVFGLLFYLVAIIQMVIRPEFDLRRHAIIDVPAKIEPGQPSDPAAL